MNFELTEEQQMIQQAARDYAQRELLKDVLERDEKCEIPWNHINALKELGFFGMMVDPEWGGGGMDTISYVLAMIELSKADSATSVILSVHNSLVCWGVEKFGSQQQKEKYLTQLATGEKIGAFLLSEPDPASGSDNKNAPIFIIRTGGRIRCYTTKNNS